jgi:hypothetical protein
MELKMSELESDKNLPAIDSFDGIENDAVEDEEGQASNNHLIQGRRLAFTNDYLWLIDDDEEFPKDRELVVIDTIRLVQKWVDKKPGAVIFLGPHEKWPSITKLNASCAKSEWGQDFNGNSQGPWHRQRVVYFVDLHTMQKYSWPSRVETVGADVCVRDFREQVRLMRQFRGARVYAVVKLSDAYMHTRYGGRQRPDLKIVRWITLDPSGTALPAPSTPLSLASASVQLDQFAESAEQTKPADPAKPVEQGKLTAKASGFHVVDPPSHSEQMGGDK